MAAIRERYGVPAKRGMEIRFQGHPAVITSANRSSQHLHVRFPNGQTAIIHPTWEVVYSAVTGEEQGA